MKKDTPAMVRHPQVLLNHVLIGACFIYMIALYWFVMGDMVLWRDEALPLLIARGNVSLGDLFNALRYEGTPGLWHFLLWVTAKVAPPSPVHAKAIHFVFFGASVFIVLFLYRVPTVFKLLFIINYPMITQYAFHVRQYQIAVTLIVLFFYFYAKEGRHKDIYMHVVLFFFGANLCAWIDSGRSAFCLSRSPSICPGRILRASIRFHHGCRGYPCGDTIVAAA